MTMEPKLSFFNKPSDWTYKDWYYSDARQTLNRIMKAATAWINEEMMSDEEKEANPTFRTTGGYLKILDESENIQARWNALADVDKKAVLSLPNFDAEIFKQCTGISVDTNNSGATSKEAEKK